MLSSGAQIGPYILVKKLGRGNFGVVWLAEHRTSVVTTQVALKLPIEEDIDVEAVKREAAIWVKASGHPNILPIISADVFQGQIVIVSEYAPGGSLYDWLERHGGKAPSVGVAVTLLNGILQGLEHLHERRIIHRDLKPANILLQGDIPRLADFGIARVLKSTSSASLVSGTPLYMSPESFDGKRSEQSDLWSVGVMAYQLLTGNFPFPGGDFMAIVGKVAFAEPEPLPAYVPEPLQAIIHRALRKKPDERFRSAREMREALWKAAYSVSLPGRPLSQAETVSATAPPTPLQKRTDTLPLAASHPNLPHPQPTQVVPDAIPTVPAPPMAGQTAAPPHLIASLPGTERVPIPQRSFPIGLLLGVATVILVSLGLVVGGSLWVFRDKLPAFSLSGTTPIGSSPVSSPSPPLGGNPASGGISELKLNGSFDNIIDMDFSADASKVLCGNFNGTLTLFDLTTNQKLLELDDDQKTLSSVKMTGDGKYAASAGYSDGAQIVRLWNLETGKVVAKISEPLVGVGGLSFSGDGSQLATGFNPRTNITLLEVPSGKKLRTIPVRTAIHTLAFSKDGKYIVAGCYNGDVEIFEAATGTAIAQSKGDGKQVYCLAISKDSRLVAAGFEDGRIKLIDLTSGEAVKILERHGAQVWRVAFAPNGKALASTSLDKTVRQWDLATGKELNRFQPEGHVMQCLAYTPDGSEIRVGHANSLIHGWQLK
ncbi:MAG: protein kinase [Acidobacteria bacterium]|nr:protein kinase [Acidobacteriota bacterium]